MRVRHIPAIVASLLASAAALPAMAQTGRDDVVVMRRLVAAPQISQAPSKMAGTWTPGEWTFDAAAPTCTLSAKRTRRVACVSNGQEVEASRCRDTRPVDVETVERLEGCTIGWTTGDFGDWTPSCGKAAQRIRTVQCQRTGGDLAPQVLDDAKCGGARPADKETGEATAGCTWRWVDRTPTFSSTCSSAAVRTVDHACVRSDNVEVDKSICTEKLGAEPSRTSTVANYDSCTYSWEIGTATPWTSGCGKGATRNVTYQCQRSNGDKNTDVSSCKAPDPSGVQTADAPNCAIANGDAENAMTGWTVNGGQVYNVTSTEAGGGTGVVFRMAHSANGYASLMGQMTCIAGTTYKVSIDTKATYGATFTVNFGNNNTGPIPGDANNTTWRTTVRYMQPQFTGKCSIQVLMRNNSGSAATGYFDNLSVEAQ